MGSREGQEDLNWKAAVIVVVVFVVSVVLVVFAVPVAFVDAIFAEGRVRLKIENCGRCWKLGEARRSQF